MIRADPFSFTTRHRGKIEAHSARVISFAGAETSFTTASGDDAPELGVADSALRRQVVFQLLQVLAKLLQLGLWRRPSVDGRLRTPLVAEKFVFVVS